MGFRAWLCQIVNEDLKINFFAKCFVLFIATFGKGGRLSFCFVAMMEVDVDVNINIKVDIN